MTTAAYNVSVKNKKNKVFVSYSHKDKKWLKQLQTHLRPLVRSDEIDLWDDTRIQSGSIWREEIQTAINDAKVAVLLVSAAFLASDFIHNDELAPLLKKAKDEGTLILPIIISPCRFNETKNISQFQAVNDPAKPLAAQSSTKQDEIFLDLSRRIERAFSL